MAITYDYIKGKSKDESTERYTLIKFNTDKSPNIIKNHSDADNRVDLGTILTSSANQYIAESADQTLYMKNNLFISGREEDGSNNTKSISIISDQNNTGQLKIINFNNPGEASIGYGTTYTNSNYTILTNGWTVGLGCDGGTGQFVWHSNVKSGKRMWLTDAGHLETYGSITAGTRITARTSIEAPYFNAASDFRAKQDIVSLPSALNFVLDTDIYTFTFKEDPQKKRTVGVIAQNLQDKTLYGVNFVNKPENQNDMLSVNESKFVYVLWRAIQEQQEEIAELRSQIAELKKE